MVDELLSTCMDSGFAALVLSGAFVAVIFLSEIGVAAGVSDGSVVDTRVELSLGISVVNSTVGVEISVEVEAGVQATNSMHRGIVQM